MSVEQSNKNNNNKTLWFKATRGYQVLITHSIWLVTGCLWNHLNFSTCLAGCSLLSLLLWTFLLGLMFVVLCAGLDGSLVVLMVHVFLWMFSASCLWIFSFWLVAVPRHCKWALSNLFFDCFCFTLPSFQSSFCENAVFVLLVPLLPSLVFCNLTIYLPFIHYCSKLSHLLGSCRIHSLTSSFFTL